MQFKKSKKIENNYIYIFKQFYRRIKTIIDFTYNEEEYLC